MCKTFLTLITKIYPFQHLISRKSYLKWNFILTIVYIMVFINNWITPKNFILSTYVILILSSPIYIYQYLKKEYLVGNIFLCVFQVILMGTTIYLLV